MQICFSLGEGYVHRLLLQVPFGTASADRSGTSEKLVEISDPRTMNDTGVRSTTAKLSSAQEEMVIHRKLEAVASQYSNILTIQLNRQRLMYESQLRLLEAKFDAAGPSVSNTACIIATGNNYVERTPVTAGGDWSTKITASLKAERQRLIQQCDNLQQRLIKSEKEHSVLEALNQSLVKNFDQWQHIVASAEAELSIAELALRTELPPLERRVREIMLQLETKANEDSS